MWRSIGTENIYNICHLQMIYTSFLQFEWSGVFVFGSEIWHFQIRKWKNLAEAPSNTHNKRSLERSTGKLKKPITDTNLKKKITPICYFFVPSFLYTLFLYLDYISLRDIDFFSRGCFVQKYMQSVSVTSCS